MRQYRIDTAQILGDEALGTKDKFWVEYEGEDWLFKVARPNTGEDWSEKLAAEIAYLLKISAAHVELASCLECSGTISRSFVDRDSGEELIHGNEVLGGLVFNYDQDQRWGQTLHTVENIANALRVTFPNSEETTTALRQLAGYIVLDGLIGNVDRHHENWGLLKSRDSANGPPTTKYSIAPSFDHASSLGRELLEPRLKQKLGERDGVEKYIAKGCGAIYIDPKSKKGVNPLYLVKRGLQDYSDYFQAPIESLKSVPLSDILDLVDKIPEDRISEIHVEFVKQFLTFTYSQICKLVP